MEVAIKKKKKKSSAGGEANIEVAASEISAARGISIIIISYISLSAIFSAISSRPDSNANKKWML